MKTGELLITINKKDIKYLLKDLLRLEHNKLSPLADTIDSKFDHVAGEDVLNSIAQNTDIVSCLKIIALPVSTCHVRIGGPATELSDLFICRVDDKSFVLLYSTKESYQIQYGDNANDLTGLLKSVLLNDIDKNSDVLFPENMNIETFFLFLNIIDCYRYVFYRDALKHRDLGIVKLTVAEFGDLMKKSMTHLDLRWMISNLITLIPEVIKYYKNSDESNFNYLFDNGYLLSGKDNNTGEEYLLMNVLSVEIGAEFMNVWYKSVGIEVEYLENGAVKTMPLAFISSTARSNHCFIFNDISENVNYQLLDNINSNDVISKILASMKSNITDKLTEPVSETSTIKFCKNCGVKIKFGAKFCGSCGNRV